MDLVTRLRRYIDHLSMPVTQFADLAGIPRPSMSQLLSGRNKKVSNELISKIHDAFPSLNVLWLMFGQGDMLVKENIASTEPYNLDFGGAQTDEAPDVEPVKTGTIDFSAPQPESPEKSSSASVASPYPPLAPEQPQGGGAMMACDYEEPAPYGNSPAPTVLENLRGTYPFIDYDEPKKPSGTDRSTPSSHDKPATPRSAMAERPNASRQEAAHSPARGREQQPEPQRKAQPFPAGKPISLSGAEPSGRRIVNIIVYYSDNSFEAFVPEHP